MIKMVSFLADECVFIQTVRLLKEWGFQVIRVQDLGMIGAPDSEVFKKAISLKVPLLTNDKGFADLRRYPLSDHYGVIVLKMSPKLEHISSVHNMLKLMLSKERVFENRLFIVDANKYRIRRG